MDETSISNLRSIKVLLNESSKLLMSLWAC